jgi:UDP-N-acetylglucosamine--N-acetylmuramyl-(pentapeptide) pyrophosphoryl-undecaprenol N-acetylglucosamine transferase
LAGQCDELDELKQTYAQAGIPSSVMPFSTNMAAAWGAATLALSRCGASSVAEAVANAVPTIFCPYPWHRDQHQAMNAQPYVDDGVAWLVDDAIDPGQNFAAMGGLLLTRLSDLTELNRVAAVLRDRQTKDPARTIAQHILAQTNGPPTSAAPRPIHNSGEKSAEGATHG